MTVPIAKPTSTPADLCRLFNWHPLLMVLAWIGFSSEALLAYRSPYVKDLNRWLSGAHAHMIPSEDEIVKVC